MTGPMDHARFEELAEAYGADVSRWPSQAREAAALLMAAEADFTGEALAHAAALDATLDAWRSASASAAVVDRILAAAPRPRGRWPVWFSPAALGAGLAAAGAAGVILGVQLSARTSAGEMAVTNALNAVSAPFELEAGA